MNSTATTPTQMTKCHWCAGYGCEPALKGHHTVNDNVPVVEVLELVPCWYCKGTSTLAGEHSGTCEECEAPIIDGVCYACSRFKPAPEAKSSDLWALTIAEFYTNESSMNVNIVVSRAEPKPFKFSMPYTVTASVPRCDIEVEGDFGFAGYDGMMIPAADDFDYTLAFAQIRECKLYMSSDYGRDEITATIDIEPLESQRGPTHRFRMYELRDIKVKKGKTWLSPH